MPEFWLSVLLDRRIGVLGRLGLRGTQRHQALVQRPAAILPPTCHAADLVNALIGQARRHLDVAATLDLAAGQAELRPNERAEQQAVLLVRPDLARPDHHAAQVDLEPLYERVERPVAGERGEGEETLATFRVLRLLGSWGRLYGERT